MKNKHEFEAEVELRCPFQACGKTFTRKIHIEYVTNQRGDVISQKIK